MRVLLAQGKRIAFHRARGAELAFSGGCFAPSIVHMRPTAPVSAGTPTPTLMLSLTLAPAEQATMPWPPNPSILPLVAERSPYEVRLHVYQARDLPARDDNGALDPFVTASICGVKLASKAAKERTATLKRTRHPLW